MNWEILLVLVMLFVVPLLIAQRAEKSRRLFTLAVMLIGLEVVRRYIVYRGWNREGLWAFGAALLINLLFWVLIGRSNPPLDSAEEIEVFDNK